MKNRTLYKFLGLALFATISATQLNAQENKEFVINGTVKNARPGTKVFLELNPNNQPLVLDSTTTDNAGKFTLRRSDADGGNIYLVNINNQQKVVVIAEGGENFTLTADGFQKDAAGTIGKSLVSGSKNMDYYEKIRAVVDPKNEQFEKWKEEYRVAEQKGDQTRMNEIQSNFAKTHQELTDQVKPMIKEMGPTLVAVFTATNFLNPDTDMALLRELSARLEKENPKPKYSQSFINGLKRFSGIVVGDNAPDFTLKAPDGSEHKLSELLGGVVLVDFWASWCRPCRLENPNVVKAYDAFKSKGLKIYGVSLDTDKKAWAEAIKKDHLAWTQGWDEQGTVSKDYGVAAIPTSFLVDKDGKVIAKNLRGPELTAKLEEVLGK